MKTASLLNDVVYQADSVEVTLIMETERSKELRICLFLSSLKYLKVKLF